MSIHTSEPTPPGSWPDTLANADTSDRHFGSAYTSAPAPLMGAEGASTISSDTQPQVQPFPQAQSQGQPTPRPAPHRGRYEPRHPNYRLTRGQLREIASTTLEKLDLGFYVPPPFKTKAEVEAEEKLKAEARLQAEIKEEAKLRAEAEARLKAEAEAKVEPDSESIQTSSTSSVEKPGAEDTEQDQPQDQIQDQIQRLDEEKAQGETETEKEKEEKKLPIYSSIYDLGSKIVYTNAHTEYYAPDDPYISNWLMNASGAGIGVDAGAGASVGAGEDASGSKSDDVEVDVEGTSTPTTRINPKTPSKTKTRILIREYSTLVGARRLHALLRRKRDKDKDKNGVRGDEDGVSGSTQDHTDSDTNIGNTNDKIGVLNFASAKKPGGGFINGSQAQEESLARTSTLYPSLVTPTASPFYSHYHDNPTSPTVAYYTHAMVYSPSVVLFRNDRGLWLSPMEVDILTSAAVNAGEVRERVRWEEEMREVRERWEKAEEERRREEEERKKEEEEREWEEVLRENKEMNMRYGEEGEEEEEEEEEEKDGNEKKEKEVEKTEETIGSTIQEGGLNPPEDKPTADNIKDDSLATPPGSFDTLSAINTSLSSGPSEHTIPISLSESEKDEDKTVQEATSPGSRHASEDQIVAAESTDLSSEPKPDPMYLAELEIEAQMYERIARVLALFASPSPSASSAASSNPDPTTSDKNNQPRTPHLILGSFGTGVFQNHIPLVARIFYDLLVRRGAPFAGVFRTVVFAILGSGTVNAFREVFSGHGGAGGPGPGVLGKDDGAGGTDVDENVDREGEGREVDEWVEVVMEGEDEDENSLEQEEEAGCEEEGVLEPVEGEVISEHEHEDEEREEQDGGGEGDDIVVDVDGADDGPGAVEEVEMKDGTHGDGDVEMLDNSDGVHVHPQELIDA